MSTMSQQLLDLNPEVANPILLASEDEIISEEEFRRPPVEICFSYQNNPETIEKMYKTSLDQAFSLVVDECSPDYDSAKAAPN